MRLSTCVGDYAKTPYCIPGMETDVYCMEEFCYAVKENIFLVDNSVMNDALLDWIDRECGLRELSRALHPLIHKKGSLSAFIITIVDYVGIFDISVSDSMERVLKEGAGLSSYEKKKSQIDYLVQKKKYGLALREYDALIQKWNEDDQKGELLPDISCLAAIYHNKAVVLAEMMQYDRAATFFKTAYNLNGDMDYLRDFLTAKRLGLSADEYIAFAANYTDYYEVTLELEKKMERTENQWEMSTEYLSMYHRRELRDGKDRQRYIEENERVTHALKNSYRDETAG